MSTRSNIIVERRDGKWAAIYCHSDGYLEYNGRMLHEHYNNQERAEAVVAPGDMSFLKPRCDKPRGHTFGKPSEGCSVYYGRDRKEKGTGASVFPTLNDAWEGYKDSGSEFVYVWTKGRWTVAYPKHMPAGLVELAEVLRTPATFPNDKSSVNSSLLDHEAR